MLKTDFLLLSLLMWFLQVNDWTTEGSYLQATKTNPSWFKQKVGLLNIRSGSQNHWKNWRLGMGLSRQKHCPESWGRTYMVRPLPPLSPLLHCHLWTSDVMACVTDTPSPRCCINPAVLRNWVSFSYHPHSTWVSEPPHHCSGLSASTTWLMEAKSQTEARLTRIGHFLPLWLQIGLLLSKIH